MNLHETLTAVKEGMLPMVDNTTHMAKAIALIGCLFFVAKELYTAIAKPSENGIDLYKFGKPFMMAIVISMFSSIVITPLDSILGSISGGFSQIVDNRDEEFESKKLELDRLMLLSKADVPVEDLSEDKLQELLAESEEISSWWTQIKSIFSFENIRKWVFTALSYIVDNLYTAVRAVIYVISTFYLIVLAVFGPISFAFDCFPNWSGTVNHWLTTYITTWLWVPIADILASIINSLNIVAVDAAIITIKTGVDPRTLWNDPILLFFQVVGIIGFLNIPTLASWIIKPTSSSGSYNKALTSAGTSLAKKFKL